MSVWNHTNRCAHPCATKVAPIFDCTCTIDFEYLLLSLNSIVIILKGHGFYKYLFNILMCMFYPYCMLYWVTIIYSSFLTRLITCAHLLPHMLYFAHDKDCVNTTDITVYPWISKQLFSVGFTTITKYNTVYIHSFDMLTVPTSLTLVKVKWVLKSKSSTNSTTSKHSKAKYST